MKNAPVPVQTGLPEGTGESADFLPYVLFLSASDRQADPAHIFRQLTADQILIFRKLPGIDHLISAQNKLVFQRPFRLLEGSRQFLKPSDPAAESDSALNLQKMENAVVNLLRHF